MVKIKGFFGRFFSKKKAVHSGVIEQSIFAYVAPKLIILTCLVIIFCGMSFDTLLVYFNTNVALNGLIISLIIFAAFGIFHNKYQLYRTGMFLHHIEGLIDNDDVTEEEVEALKLTLTRQGKLLNTRNMHDALTNIALYQHPNFTDADARVIQSKLGNRISFRHASVGFIAGVLVMLGLLGTFMGLLKTIDAVGMALDGMSQMGAGGGELGMEQMSEFIGSLARPLQGMGLAFSSSLFGLSGSLIISVLNKFGMDVHDGFIENVSRWVDNRILKPKGSVGSTDVTSMGGAENNDFQSWLAGFIYLSNKTNKRLSKLSLLLYKTHETQTGVRDACIEIASHQKESSESLKTVASGISSIKDNTEFVKDTVTEIATGVENVQEKQIRSLELQEDSAESRHEVVDTLKVNTQHLGDLTEVVEAGAEVRRDVADTLNLNTKQLKDLIDIVEESTEFSYEHKKLFVDVVENAANKQVINMDKNAEMLTSLLSDMIEDMNDKVESNVIDFMKEKHKMNNIEDGIKDIISSQGGFEKEMAALIREMNLAGSAPASKISTNIKTKKVAVKTSGSRDSIIARLFSGGKDWF